MEEFQSLLGSKTYRRKQARQRGHLVGASAENSMSYMQEKTLTSFNTMAATFSNAGKLTFRGG